MLTPQLTPEQALWLDRHIGRDIPFTVLPGLVKQWGLGFMILSKGFHTGRSEGSATWNGFANTHWMVDPVKGVVVSPRLFDGELLLITRTP